MDVLLGTDSFTLSALVRWDDFTHPAGGYLPFAKGYGEDNEPRIQLGEIHVDGEMRIELADGVNAVADVLTFDAGRDNTWFTERIVHMVIIIDRDAGRVRVYIDGVKQADEVDISSVTGNVSNAHDLRIGSAEGWLVSGGV